MANLGAGVKARWSKEFELDGATHRTEYALRANSTLVRKDSYKQWNQYDKKFHWHDWGWKVVKPKGSMTEFEGKVVAAGFTRVK